ncbi:MAG: hypothetical protein HY738_11780 [Bacteroidia bacterium]|nr:hypothetical protein [Bacteroidia bacterium]
MSCIQANSQRIFYLFGFSVFGNYIISPIKRCEFNYPDTTIYAYWKTFSIGTIVYKIRVNIVEFNDNASLSITNPISVSLGMSFRNGYSGMGYLNIPLLAEFNFYNGATFKTDKDHGLSAGLGAEFICAPVMPLFFESAQYWIQPAASIGYSFWTAKNTPMHLGFKYGFRPSFKYYKIDGAWRLNYGQSFLLTLLFMCNY